MRNDVKFAYMDITENMAALKSFVNFREKRAEFNKVKELGGLGVPCIVVNNGEKIILDSSEEALRSLL